MYTAGCFVSMSGSRESLIRALEILKEKSIQLAGEFDQTSRGRRRSYNAGAEISSVPKRLDEIVASLQKEPQQQTHKTGFSFPYPLHQYCALTEDAGFEDVFFDVAAALKDDQLDVSIEWEGPGDNHEIEIKVSEGIMNVRCYDWDADWASDSDDESDVSIRERTTYHFQENGWVK